jgi:hypothetical protein
MNQAMKRVKRDSKMTHFTITPVYEGILLVSASYFI